MLWNNELRFPISESLQGVLFIDVGDAWQGAYAAQFGDATYDLHYGYGLGIRVITPIGPLRLDYGFNGEGGHQFHFGVGFNLLITLRTTGGGTCHPHTDRALPAKKKQRGSPGASSPALLSAVSCLSCFAWCNSHGRRPFVCVPYGKNRL